MLRLGDIIIYNSDRVTVTAIYHSAGSIELTDGRGDKTNERLSDVYDELLKQERERADQAEELIKRAIEIGECRLNDLSNGVTSIGFGERKGIEQVLSELKNLERGEDE